MLGGALIPGKPVANMYFTMYGYNPVVQSLALLKDLKLVYHIHFIRCLMLTVFFQGQYTKLPPRATFTIQIIGTVIVSYNFFHFCNFRTKQILREDY